MPVPTCPSCGAHMTLRTNRKTDEKFYGCTFYPECTGTRPADEEVAAEDETPSERYSRNGRERWRRE